MAVTQPGEKTCPFIFIDQLLKERQITSRGISKRYAQSKERKKTQLIPPKQQEVAEAWRKSL